MRRFFYILASFILFLSMPVTAATHTTNEQTGYSIIIEDNANLISEADEARLIDIMKQVSIYGHAVFHTIDSNSTTTRAYIKEYYHYTLGNDSGMVFLIDMDNRYIYIYCDGYMYTVINSDYADIITDNVYTYASDGDYYTCAFTAFSQALDLLKGQKIIQPMKYISNALLAVTLSLLLSYGIVLTYSRAKKPSNKELIASTYNKVDLGQIRSRFSYSTKRYSPRKSSSSSGGSGGGGSGGGGGHRF